MSVVPTSNYSVLLPAATVGVFSNHEDTRAAVAGLASDWRFARVRFDIRPGDAAAAIALYAQMPSPHLLLLDTDLIDQGFTAQLEQLAATCSEGTNAVVVGPVNDVAMYRYLISIGVSDYLVRPLQPATISDVIARILIEQLGASGSSLVAIIGAKGGAGTSTVAELLAYGLGEVAKQKTIVMDMAAGRSYLSVAFGAEPSTTLHEAMRAATASDPNVLTRMLQKAGQNLQVLGTGNDHFLDDTVSIDALERLLDRLLAVTPYVVADLSGATPSVQRLVLSRAQRVFMVSLPTLSSLRLARTLMSEIKEIKGGSFDGIDMVINMIGIAPGAEMGRGDIQSALGQRVSVALPFDPKLVVGSEAQAKVLGSAKGAERMVSDLIARLNVGVRPVEAKKTPATGLLDNFFRGSR